MHCFNVKKHPTTQIQNELKAAGTPYYNIYTCKTLQSFINVHGILEWENLLKSKYLNVI